jgi:hypothetical protein
MTLSPSTQNVDASPDNQTVQFNGTVTVGMSRVGSEARVDLKSSVDIGWASNCNPSQMVFSSSSTQNFICTVVVPAGANNATATLEVHGQLFVGPFQWLTSASTYISVGEFPSQNNNTPSPGTSSGMNLSESGDSPLLIIASISAIIIIVFLAVLIQKRRQTPASAEKITEAK